MYKNGGRSMKATGITKQIDPTGRLLIPKPVRKALNVSEGDVLEFFIGNDGEAIIRKYEIFCVFCRADEDLIDFENKKICDMELLKKNE